MQDKVRIVFDVDDTICSNHRKTGYDKNEPDVEVIKKINHMHDELGFYIILHTSRGMISCNGDEAKIIKKNKDVLEKWLKDNDVHYDELIFCKPIADLYVDDKALNVADFKEESFEVLQGGGSNKPIYKLGKVVKKTMSSEEDLENFKDWVEDNNGMCKYPKVISYLQNSVYMEYIDGSDLSMNVCPEDILEIIKTIFKFSSARFEEFSLKPQISILDSNRSEDEEFNKMIDICKNALIDNEEKISKHASFSHGDMILSNVMKDNHGELYYIDSRYFRKSSSYLFDFAKLRMSLSGYETTFLTGCSIDKNYVSMLDNILKAYGVYELVVILHLMYVLRLYRYKNTKGKIKVKEIAERIIKSNEKLFARY